MYIECKKKGRLMTINIMKLNDQNSVFSSLFGAPHRRTTRKQIVLYICTNKYAQNVRNFASIYKG